MKQAIPNAAWFRLVMELCGFGFGFDRIRMFYCHSIYWPLLPYSRYSLFTHSIWNSLFMNFDHWGECIPFCRLGPSRSVFINQFREPFHSSVWICTSQREFWCYLCSMLKSVAIFRRCFAFHALHSSFVSPHCAMSDYTFHQNPNKWFCSKFRENQYKCLTRTSINPNQHYFDLVLSIFETHWPVNEQLLPFHSSKVLIFKVKHFNGLSFYLREWKCLSE